MNAGGVPNTCKSNEILLIFGDRVGSGERVSNALVTCPKAGDNSLKELLIPYVIIEVRVSMIKAPALWEGPASHQLVGKVTAYQGYYG